MAASRVREGGRTFPDSHTDGPPDSIVALSRLPPLGAILILLPVYCQSPSASLIFEDSLTLLSAARQRRARRGARADGDAVADGEAVGEAVGAVVTGTG